MKIQFSILAVSMALLSCEESKDSVRPRDQHFDSKISNKSENEGGSVYNSEDGAEINFPTLDIEDEGSQFGGEIVDLVSDHGNEALLLIYTKYSGEQRDDAMNIALSRLVKDSDIISLLEILGGLPAGEAKQKWIWQAVSKGKESENGKLFKIMANLEFLEDRKTAINAFAFSTNSFRTSKDFNEFHTFLSTNSGVNQQFAEGMASNALRRLSANMVDHRPANILPEIEQLPEILQKDAVEMILRSYVGAKDTTSAFEMLSVLEGSPELARQGYRATYNVVGELNPGQINNLIGHVPESYREDAIMGFMSGWLAQDSMAASDWAAKQPGEDLKSSAKAIVQHLRNRKAPDSEIAAWQAIIDQP